MKRDPVSPWPLLVVFAAMLLMFGVAIGTNCNGGPPPYPETLTPHASP